MVTPTMGIMYPQDPRAYNFPSIYPQEDPTYPKMGVSNSSNLPVFIICHMKQDPILHGVIPIGVIIFLKNIQLLWKTLQQLCPRKMGGHICHPLYRIGVPHPSTGPLSVLQIQNNCLILVVKCHLQ